MGQLIHSSFMQALGYAIVNSLWQFGLLWLAYLLINSLFQISSHKKYTTGLLLQFAGFLWFVLTIVFYYKQIVALGYANGVGAAMIDFDSFSLSGSFKNNVILGLLRTEQFLPYLSFSYLLRLLVLGIKWFRLLSNTGKLRTSKLQKIDVQYRMFVDALCNQMGIKKPVKIYLSALIKSPLTIGFLKPLILLPAASINYLSVEQLEAVILHEISHIKRADFLMNIILSLVEVALFFNPFMQLLSRHIKRERENSCDDWVLQYEYNASNYAKALLEIAATQVREAAAGFAINAVDQRYTLLIRVKRMLEKKDRTFNYRNQLFALLLLSGGLFVCTLFTPPGSKATKTEVATKNLVLNAEPLVARVNNPLFNPAFFLLAEKKQDRNIQPESHQPGLFIKDEVVSTEDFRDVKELQIAEAPSPVEPSNIEAGNIALASNAANGFAIINDSIDAAFKMDLTFRTLQKNWKDIEKKINALQVHASVKREALAALSAESAKVSAQLSQALHQVNVTIAFNKRNGEKLAATRLFKEKANQAAEYYKKLNGEGELLMLAQQLQAQIEKVNFEDEKASLNWAKPKYPDAEPFITITPNIAPAHIYSYDYNERQARHYPESIDVDEKISTNEDRKGNRLIEKQKIVDTPPGPAALAPIKHRKILKVVRI